jgi:hypothetical protein
MGVRLGVADKSEARERRQPSAQSEWSGSHSNRRRHRHCHGQAAIAARSNADFAGRLVGRGRGLLGAAVAKDGLRLIDGLGGRARGAKIRNKAGERNRISGGQRNQALPQRPLGESCPHPALQALEPQGQTA